MTMMVAVADNVVACPASAPWVNCSRLPGVVVAFPEAHALLPVVIARELTPPVSVPQVTSYIFSWTSEKLDRFLWTRQHHALVLQGTVLSNCGVVALVAVVEFVPLVSYFDGARDFLPNPECAGES